MKRFKLFTIVFLGLSSMVFAQQDPLFTQYTYNKLLVNPAYAGNDEGLSLTLVNRAQWISIEGAPNTLTLSAHTVSKNRKVGLGLYIFRDAIGPTVSNGLMGTYSYRLINEEAVLSFGIQGGINYFDFNYAKMNLKDADYLFDPSDVRSITPDVNIGLYYKDDKYFAGISSKHLLENDFGFVQSDKSTSFERLSRHYYIVAGRIFNLVDDINLISSTLVKFVSSAPVQFDVNATVLFKDKFRVGMSYRTQKAITFMAGIGLSNRLKLGLSYDFYFNELQLHNYGSSEIRLQYILGRKQNELVSVNAMNL